MATRKRSPSVEASPKRGRSTTGRRSMSRKRSTSRGKTASSSSSTTATRRKATRATSTRAMPSPSVSPVRPTVRAYVEELSPMKLLHSMSGRSSSPKRASSSRSASASHGSRAGSHGHHSLSEKLKPYGYESQKIRRFYMLVFNAVSCILWSYLLLKICKSLFMDKLMEAIFPSWSQGLTRAAASAIGVSPSWMHSLCNASKAIYDHLGYQIGIVQALSLLEMVHAKLGWTPSRFMTTALQVLVRNFIIWVVCIQKGTPEVRHHPAFALMAFCWALMDVIRYAYYFCHMACSKTSKVLSWLRYSLFYVLYPAGAGAEMILAQTFVRTASASALPDCCRHMMSLALFAYLPVFYIIYGHMIQQRKKNLK